MFHLPGKCLFCMFSITLTKLNFKSPFFSFTFCDMSLRFKYLRHIAASYSLRTSKQNTMKKNSMPVTEG